jgi:AcrR family transcriptional regulator
MQIFWYAVGVMSSLGTPSPKLGLRERKKQQTREKITRVALELFAQRGYDETTLADIAEAAEVAPRTIFAYFDGKDDILLCQEDVFLDELKRRLEERPAGTTTVDAISGFLSRMQAPDESSLLRKKVMTDTPSLQMKLRGHHAQLEPMLAESVAKDLDAEPGDIRPMLIAASMTAAFMAARDKIFEAEAAGEPMSHEQGMAILDEVLEFLRGGLEAVQRD